MSALEFLLRGRREVEIAYFNHKTDHGDKAENFVTLMAADLGLSCYVGYPVSEKKRKESQEAFWHRERHSFFEKFKSPVVLAHHLSDAVEWWIFSSFRGKPGLMPVRKPLSNIMRPFLLSKKEDLHRFKKYNHIEDPSNQSTEYARNFIRREISPLAKIINPGIETTVRNLYDV